MTNPLKTVEDIISGAAREVAAEKEKQRVKREQVRRRKERWGWLLEKKRNGGSKGADESASEGGAASIEEEKEALEEDTGSDGMRTSAANHFQTAGVLEFNNDRFGAASQWLSRALKWEPQRCEARYWMCSRWVARRPTALICWITR